MAGEFLPPVVTRLTGDLDDLATVIGEAKALIASLDGKTVTVAVSTRGISGPVHGAIAEIERLKAAMASLDDKTVKIGVDSGLGGAALRGALGGLVGGAFRGIFGLTGNAIHWLIAGFAELAAVVIPATIAIAAWAAVWLQGTQMVQQHLQAVYAAAESLANMGGQTAGQMVGLGHALQTAQNAANPNVWQAYGAGINLVREHAGGLTSAGLQLGRVFDTFAAKVVQDFSKGGSLSGPLDALTSHMVQDATGIGQVFGNIGHALLGFASQMPGLAEVLLGALSGITHLIAGAIDLSSHLTFMHVSLLTAAMGFEEFNRWGSLAVSGLSKVGLGTVAVTGGFFSLTRAAGVLKNIMGVVPAALIKVGEGISYIGGTLTGSSRVVEFGHEVSASADAARASIAGMSTGGTLAITALAAAFGFLIYEGITAKDATQQFVATLQSGVAAASSLNAINVIGSAYLSVAQRVNTAEAAIANAQHVQATGAAGWQNAARAIGVWRQQLSELNPEQSQLSSQLVITGTRAAQLAATYHTTLTGALLLADQAGVKLQNTLNSSAWAVAQLKIANFVQGIRAMNAPAGAAGNDVMMMGIQAGLAASDVSKVNQAADQFMQNLTGGMSAVAAFTNSLKNMTGVAATTGIANLGRFADTGTLKIKDFAQALTSFTGQGATAWQNFNQVVGSTAPQIIDWLRIAGTEGAVSSGQFNRAVLSMLAPLTQLASRSRPAQAELLGLARDAGLNVRTFPGLIRQINAGHVSAATLARIIAEATAKMGDMAQVAQTLGNVLQSSLIQAMDAAKIQASGVAAATLAFERSVMNSGAAVNSTNPKYVALMGDLEKLGYTASQAAKLISILASNLAGVHSKSVTLSVNTVYSQTGAPPPVSGSTFHHMASGGTARPGWTLVGEQGPELVHFGKAGGQVIPNHMLSGRSGGSYEPVNPSEFKFQILLDGQELHDAQARLVFADNVRNGNRSHDGRPRGVYAPRPVS